MPLCQRKLEEKTVVNQVLNYTPSTETSPDPPCSQYCSAESQLGGGSLTGVCLPVPENQSWLLKGSSKAVSHLFFPSSGLHGHSGAENKRFSFGHG